MKPVEQPSTSVRNNGRPSTAALVRRFVGGTVYLLLVALVFAGTTKHSFLTAFAITVSSALTIFAIALVLLVRWALRDEGRPWQIQLSSLFLIVAILSIYLSVMRWWVSGLERTQELSTSLWMGLVTLSLVFIVFGIPFVLFLGESLLWLAVWIIHRPAVRRLLRALMRLPGGWRA